MAFSSFWCIDKFQDGAHFPLIFRQTPTQLFVTSIGFRYVPSSDIMRYVAGGYVEYLAYFIRPDIGVGVNDVHPLGDDRFVFYAQEYSSFSAMPRSGE